MCLANQTGEVTLGLIVASEELLFNELFMYLQDYMIKYQLIWIQKNLVLVLHTVSKISKFEKLRDHCIQFILKDPQMLIVSKKFLLLDEDILSELLKRDDLEIEEISIWNYLIKWGIEQTKGLGSENDDRTKWNNENYEALKETLSELIPLIRFSEISSADFFDKVHPFMAVIPNHIYEEVLKFYMKGTLSESIPSFPPRVGTIDTESKIISSKQAYIIANLIDKKDAKAIRKKNDLKYKFEFRYRYRSDSRSFNNDAINEVRNICERRQEPCLILVNKNQYTYTIRNTVHQETTSQNLKKIYGEYNSFTPQNDNFIFCFENENDIKSTKINRNTNTQILFNKDSNGGQIVRVTMLEHNNGNFSLKNDDFAPKVVEVFTVNTVNANK
jgi:hypothetical protein